MDLLGLFFFPPSIFKFWRELASWQTSTFLHVSATPFSHNHTSMSDFEPILL